MTVRPSSNLGYSSGRYLLWTTLGVFSWSDEEEKKILCLARRYSTTRCVLYLHDDDHKVLGLLRSQRLTLHSGYDGWNDSAKTQETCSHCAGKQRHPVVRVWTHTQSQTMKDFSDMFSEKLPRIFLQTLSTFLSHLFHLTYIIYAACPLKWGMGSS